MIFFIASVAETNRAPFDLAEAESELVSGFMTEHSAVVFVFFFLAEYASIILMCILLNIVFLGGYDPSYLILILYYCVSIVNYLFQMFLIITSEIYNIIHYIIYSEYIHYGIVNITNISKEHFINEFSLYYKSYILKNMI